MIDVPIWLSNELPRFSTLCFSSLPGHMQLNFPASSMLKFRSNGAQSFSLLHGLGRLFLYSTSSGAESSRSFINYLVDSLGFSEQQATSVSTRLTRIRPLRRVKSDFDSIGKAHSIVNFFKKNGFDQSQIRSVVLFNPRVLRSIPDKTLKRKVDSLREWGLSRPIIPQVASVIPLLMFKCTNSDTMIALQTLKEFLGSYEDVIRLLIRSQGASIHRLSTVLMPNVALLLNYGIPTESIRKRVLKRPRCFLQRTVYFEDILIRVEQKLGIPRGSEMFLYGVILLGSLREETIHSKCQIFKSFGWTEPEIRDLIRRQPFCVASSEARIKKSLEFLMKELCYEPHFLISNVHLLTCSLEKRIIPRHKVLLVLEEKGLIRKTPSLGTLTRFTEAMFLKKFVLPFKEVHQVYAESTAQPVELLTQGNADTHS